MSQEPEPKVLHEPLFAMRNQHYDFCGKPPFISNEENSRKRFAYFENHYGEQLVFVYDRDQNTGLLYHGDAGWEKPRPVVDGAAPELVLDDAEQMWLVACWSAATRLPVAETIERARAQYRQAAHEAQRHIWELERKSKQTGRSMLDLFAEEQASQERT